MYESKMVVFATTMAIDGDGDEDMASPLDGWGAPDVEVKTPPKLELRGWRLGLLVYRCLGAQDRVSVHIGVPARNSQKHADCTRTQLRSVSPSVTPAYAVPRFSRFQ